VCTGGHVHIDGCKYYSFTVYECISIENVPSCLGSFDPSSPLTAYVDHEACGVRGDDANADLSGCQYGATLVCSQPWGSWGGYFVDGCEYYEFHVYECNDDPSHRPSSEPSSSSGPSFTPSTIPSSNPSVTKCFPNARRVKLEAVPAQRLQLHVVQVFSSLVDGDIANGKPAAQSSTRMPRTVAAAAIDGDKVSFSRTNDDNAWWQVDLEESYPIKAVYIGNHYCKHSPDPTECRCHLTGVNIILLDDANATVTNQVLGDTCGSPRQVVEFERKFECVQSAALFDEL
jgi:hypothetical protein